MSECLWIGWRQRQRGGGLAYANSRLVRVVISVVLGDILIYLKNRAISAMEKASLACAVHSRPTVLPPPLVTGCAAAAED